MSRGQKNWKAILGWRGVGLWNVVLLVCVSQFFWIFAEAPNPETVEKEIKDLALQPGGARTVSQVRIQNGPGVLTLESGLVFPATAVGGRNVAFVFLGQGRFQCSAPDDIERHQLNLFTGSNSLDEKISAALLITGTPSQAEALLSGPAADPVDPEKTKEAGKFLEDWKNSTEGKFSRYDRNLLRLVLEQGAWDQYFLGFLKSEFQGQFLFSINPDEEEALTLEQFVPLELEKYEKDSAARVLKKEQKKGRMDDMEVKDLGNWDTWVSASLRDDKGMVIPTGSPFNVDHYKLDVRLAKGNFDFQGKAVLTLAAKTGGRRTVVLALNDSLQVNQVSRADGSPLFFRQKGPGVLVVLPSVLAAGEKVDLSFDYDGQIIEKEGADSYYLKGTFSWYPTLAGYERSTFDVTFHYPKKYKIVASGKRVENGVEGDMAWEKRVMDTKVLGFTFEIGDFRLIQTKAGHVDVTIALDPMADFYKEVKQEDIEKTVIGGIQYFEQLFGPYPLDYLSVATVPRSFSQGGLSLVTLSTYHLSVPDDFRDIFMITLPQAVIAHELAHQWWGNLVGWKSYRDQWISEALANYSAMMYTRDRIDPKQGAVIVPTRGWKSELGEATEHGVPVDGVGPVVMGTRLQCSIASAYNPVVYKKGAVILNMLGRTFRNPADFQSLLRRLIIRTAGTSISTGDFLKIAQQISSTDFDPFARQFIYGTGIPDIFYSYQIGKNAAMKWVIKGQADQKPSFSYHYSLRNTSDGGLDLARSRAEVKNLATSAYVVPLQILIFRQPGPAGRKASAADGQLEAMLLMKGTHAEFEIPLDFEPVEVRLDGRNEIYANFYNATMSPRKVAYFEALDLADQGKWKEAEDLYRKALTLKVKGDSDMGPNFNKEAQEFEGDLLEKLINLGLTRIYLEQDQMVAAEKAFKEVQTARIDLKETIGDDLILLQARFDLRAGKAEEVLKTLKKKFMGLNKPKKAEAYLLIALAAKKTGDEKTFEEARRLAFRFGADTSAL